MSIVRGDVVAGGHDEMVHAHDTHGQERDNDQAEGSAAYGAHLVIVTPLDAVRAQDLAPGAPSA